MQWAVTAHGHEGKVHADRRTVEYFGRGNHARDAACFRATRPVSSFAPKNESNKTKRKKNTKLKKEHMMLQIAKSIHSAGAAAESEDDKEHGGTLAGREERDGGDAAAAAAAMSLSKLRVFYYETLVVSTGDEGESGLGHEDEIEKDARAELDLLMARANAAAAAISSHHPTSTVSSSGSRSTTTTTTTSSHPYLAGGSRQETTRLPWRERARRIVHANLRATDPLIQDLSSSDDDDGEADDEGGAERMELDSTATTMSSATNSNGNGSTAGNGESGRGFAIRQFLSGSSATSAAGSNGANHHSRLLSLTGSSSSAQSRSRSSSNSSSNNNNTANGVHFAFTLSSRTLQQIRSRHDRRRMRRHQEKKRFNHRIGVGFVLASKSNSGTRGGEKNEHDGLSQVSNASSSSSINISNNNSVTSTTSTSPLQKLASYQQRKTVSHEDLGKDAFSLAYHGKTGRIMSNDQVFLQCEKFGSGDVVGCGILLDTKTFFFTLNGRLLGMLAATDVHHFDDFVDDGAENRDGDLVDGVDDDDAESDVSFVTDDDDESNGESGDHVVNSQGDATLFEDVLYPAISLHDAGECASANFDEFQFDLAGFERQIQKERQQALLLHEISDEREELANDRVINKLIQDYFLHNGYKDAYAIFQKSTSYPSGYSSVLGEDDIDVDIEEEEEKTESMDTGFPSSSRSLGSAQTKLLDLRHAVRQHIYAFETSEAMTKVRAALGDAFFLSTTTQRRSGKVLFYCRVLCVLDVLLNQRAPPVSSAKSKAANGGGNRKDDGRRDNVGWNVEEAILCAQEQFSRYLALAAARVRSPVDDSCSSSREMNDSKKDSNLFVKSVMDDELELVMSLLLYESQGDVPTESAARKFLSPKFREHVADELNVFLLVNSSPKVKKSGPRQGRRSTSFPPPPSPDASTSALQKFLIELNSLQSQCLRNGCRVFPGNHTVSSSGSKRNGRNSYRRRRRRASASSSENGNGGDEEMRSSSSGSDMSSSSSRSENDDDDDDDDDEEEE